LGKTQIQNFQKYKEKKMKLTLLSIIAFFTVFASANAEMLFVDDFEDDDVGNEPSKWEYFEFFGGNATFSIEIDPTDSNNKVMQTTAIGQYVPDVTGRENWSDYIWDFDWMWENDSFIGTLYRIQDADNAYHFSRRQGGTDLQIYACQSTWGGAIVTSQYPNENNVWYSHRLVLNGNKHEIYLKERGDPTPFEELEPVIEVEDDTFQNGPVGIMGITSGLGYYDNVAVYESPADITDVSPRNRLAQIWGKIKKQ
jgi:hypothetical protein